MSSETIGVFEIKSGVIVVSDPCYQLDGHCQVKDIQAENGNWQATIVTNDENRVMKLVAHLENYTDSWLACVSPNPSTNHLISRKSETYHGEIGVDSGQAGIYDQSFYKDDSLVPDVESIWAGRAPIGEDVPWYSLNCSKTVGKENAGVIPYGVVSSSGYGDGAYDLIVNFNENDKAVKIEIIFEDLSDDEEYEDDNYDEYEEEDEDEDEEDDDSDD